MQQRYPYYQPTTSNGTTYYDPFPIPNNLHSYSMQKEEHITCQVPPLSLKERKIALKERKIWLEECKFVHQQALACMELLRTYNNEPTVQSSKQIRENARLFLERWSYNLVADGYFSPTWYQEIGQ